MHGSPLARTLLAASLFTVLLTLGCGGLATRLMGGALEKNLTLRLPETLPDGLHVLVCGAGGPLFDEKRSAPCVAIIAGETVVVVDQGSGAARNLGRLGLQPGLVEAVFLTHFHSDHVDGLGELATLRWAGAGWTTPLPVFGPSGVERVVDGFNAAYAQDRVYRNEHHGDEATPLSGHGLTANPFPAPEDGKASIVFDQDGLQVEAFAVDHAPVSPAVGYRFEYKGRSVVISGDSDKSMNLVAQARGVDLLMHDALSPELVGIIQETAERVGNAQMAKIASDIPDYHASPVEAAEAAQGAGAKALLLYHIVPPLPLGGLERVFLEGVRDAYSGPVRIAEDGTFVSLLPGTDRIVFDER